MRWCYYIVTKLAGTETPNPMVYCWEPIFVALLEQYLEQEKSTLLLEVANDLGCVNNSLKHPYTTRDVRRLIKAATDNWICQCFENEATETELRDLEHFLTLFESSFC